MIYEPNPGIITNDFDEAYRQLLCRIINDGVKKEDRTGTGTLSVFGHMMRFDLTKGFPLITTKKIHLKSIIHELLWMLSGSTNIKYLEDNGVTIWDEWADDDGELGPVYGSSWRAWPKFEWEEDEAADGSCLEDQPRFKGEVDQIDEIIKTLQTNPWSRRIMLSAWNVAELPKMRLPPCHFNAQFNVTPPWSDLKDASPKLNCLMSIRSWDVFLGGPFNIAQYALLTMMIAQICDLEPGDLVISSGDTHLYLNHIEQAKVQIEREPRAAPRMILDTNVGCMDDFLYESFTLEGYDPHPHIKAEVSV